MKYDALLDFTYSQFVPPRWVSVTGEPTEWLTGGPTGDRWHLIERDKSGAVCSETSFDTEEAFVEAVYLRLSRPPAFIFATSSDPRPPVSAER